MNATDYKIRLLGYILRNLRDVEFVAFEVPFLSNSRIADAVVLSGGHTYAFEIKADNDRVDNIIPQLNDYKRVFDYVFLVTHKNNKSKISKIDVGKIFFDGKDLNHQRKPNKNRTRKNDLISSTRISSSNKKTPSSLKQARLEFISDLKSRYTDRYDSFQSERSPHASFEDIVILSKHGVIR